MRALRILLVEDNAQVAEVAVSVMVERGHMVVSTGSAPEALDVLNSGQPFDLILSDLVMPGGMNGLDLAQRVRSRWPALPVLLATGYSDQAARALKEGFPLISKPFEPSALLLAIERAGSPVLHLCVARQRRPAGKMSHRAVSGQTGERLTE